MEVFEARGLQNSSPNLGEIPETIKKTPKVGPLVSSPLVPRVRKSCPRLLRCQG